MKARSHTLFKRTLLLPLLLLFLLVAVSGEAALYCVVDFGGKRCQFTNLESCQKAAGEQGSCFLNREEMLAPTGGAPFCLVESWHTECVYRILANCNLVAKSRQATCITNPNLTVTPVGVKEKATQSTDTQNTDYLPSPAYQPNPGYR